MYRTEKQPAWQRDLTWASALLLAVSVAVGAALFSLARSSGSQSGVDLIQSILRLTLRPGDGGASVGVTTLTEYRAGERLRLLPGLDVYADATEIPSFTTEAAVNRGAGVLSDEFVKGGASSVLASVTDQALTAQLQLALEGPIAALVNADLSRELLGAGLDDGTRLADWPAQAAANPGEQVQPIVGVFVRFPPRELQGASNREIGAAVVAALSEQVMQGGLPQALALVTNENLRTRLTRAVDTNFRAQAHELFSAVIAGYAPAMATRLADASSVLAGAADVRAGSLSGLLPASALAGLTTEQAEARVIEELAERAYSTGAAAAAQQLTRPDQAQRVRRVAPLIDAFGSAAHRRYLAYTYLSGVVVLLLLVALVGFSRGYLRLVNPGISILVGAAPLAYGLDRVRAWSNPDAVLPPGAGAEGVPATLAGLAAYSLAVLPSGALAGPLRYHVVLLLVGAALIVLALLLWLLRGLRPRRRGYR